jgi:hypothetical protein
VFLHALWFIPIAPARNDRTGSSAFDAGHTVNANAGLYKREHAFAQFADIATFFTLAVFVFV